MSNYEALMTCPTECDEDCEADCHEYHCVTWKRQHDPEECSQNNKE
jgi:hypothetical protein